MGRDPLNTSRAKTGEKEEKKIHRHVCFLTHSSSSSFNIPACRGALSRDSGQFGGRTVKNPLQDFVPTAQFFWGAQTNSRGLKVVGTKTWRGFLSFWSAIVHHCVQPLEHLTQHFSTERGRTRPLHASQGGVKGTSFKVFREEESELVLCFGQDTQHINGRFWSHNASEAQITET